MSSINYCSKHPFRTLHRFLGVTPFGYFWMGLIHFIKQSPELYLPLMVASIIDWLRTPESSSITQIVISVGLGLVMLAGNVPFHVYYIKLVSTAIRNMEFSLRGQLVRQLQRLTISFHDSQQSGRLQAKILRDVEAVELMCRNVTNGIVPALMMLVTAIVVTLCKKPVIMLFYIVAIPLALALIRVFRSPMQRTNSEFRTKVEEMSAQVSEMLTMIPITRAHALEDVEIERNASSLEILKNKGLKLDLVMAIFGSCTWCTMQLSTIVALLVASTFCYFGHITIGEVVLFNTYFHTMMMCINQILGIYPTLVKGVESINSIGEILEVPDIEQNQGKMVLKSVVGSIDFEAVSFSYLNSNKSAVKNFNLSVANGEKIAVIGESGSGKSTLMSLIIGFLRPTDGRILLDGIDMADCDLRSYRHFLSVVPQSSMIFSGSIRENILYGIDSVTEEELLVAVKAANVFEFTKMLPQGLDTIIGENGASLSGGQKQRIAIARALIRNPRVLILDEATSALDVTSERVVQEALDRLVKDRTTFIVAHRLSTIRDADRILVMKQGEIVEIGSHDELLAQKGAYFEMYNLQNF